MPRFAFAAKAVGRVLRRLFRPAVAFLSAVGNSRGSLPSNRHVTSAGGRGDNRTSNEPTPEASGWQWIAMLWLMALAEASATTKTSAR